MVKDSDGSPLSKRTSWWWKVKFSLFCHPKFHLSMFFILKLGILSLHLLLFGFGFLSLSSSDLIVSNALRCYSVAKWLGSWTCGQHVVGSNPGHCTAECNPGQVVYTPVCHRAV